MMAVTPELRDVATALLDKQKDEMDLSTMRMTTTRLLAANAALRRELEETQRHFADNNEYLKSESATKDEFSAIQGTQLRRLQVELEALRGDSAAELAALRGASEIEVETVRVERDSLAFELEQLRQFATLKQELDATLAERNEELADLRAQLAERTREVETRVLEAREHVQQDVARKVLQNQRDMEGEMQKRLDRRQCARSMRITRSWRSSASKATRQSGSSRRTSGSPGTSPSCSTNSKTMRRCSRSCRAACGTTSASSQSCPSSAARRWRRTYSRRGRWKLPAWWRPRGQHELQRLLDYRGRSHIPPSQLAYSTEVQPCRHRRCRRRRGTEDGGGGAGGNRNRGMMGSVSDDSSDGLGAVRGGQLREINDQLDAFLASRSIEPGGSSEGGSLLRSVRQYNEHLLQRSSPNQTVGRAVPVGRASGVGRGRRGAAANRQSPRAARRLRGTGAAVKAKPRENPIDKGARNFGKMTF